MDALHGRKLNGWRESLTVTTQECCEQYWTSPGDSTPQNSNCVANYHPSRTRYAGHCLRSTDKLIRDVLLWTPSYGRAMTGRPARAYIQQLCADMGCSPEDLPEAMDYREWWRERVRDIRADWEDDDDDIHLNVCKQIADVKYYCYIAAPFEYGQTISNK